MRIFEDTLAGESVWTPENDGEQELQEKEVLEYFSGVDLTEYIIVGSLPPYSSYIDSVNDLDIYYNGGADYYFAALDTDEVDED